MVCNIGGQLGTKVVISALGMLALYMRFNGTGIWGGETIWGITVMGDFRMDTGGEKDLCLFWEWAQEYLGRSGQSGPFSHIGPSSKSNW